jgi:hypothetical protein
MIRDPMIYKSTVSIENSLLKAVGSCLKIKQEEIEVRVLLGG